LDESFGYIAKKALVAITIQRALREISEDLLDQVSKGLYKKYSSYFHDCYDHPEYLRQILIDLNVEYYDQIIATINKNLEEQSNQPDIKEFLAGLSPSQRHKGPEKRYKNSVRVAVESALLDMGVPELERVRHKLKIDYNCKIEDCYKQPEYLRRVLCDLFGDSYKDILNTIRKILKQDQHNATIERFLLVLERGIK